MDTAENSISSYKKRLLRIAKLHEWQKSREEYGFPVGHVEKTLNTHQPELVFLDTNEGVERVAQAIAQNHPVVTDYGATYGTAFSLNIRKEVAEVRREQEPLAIVSLVCSMKDALRWMNRNRLHPTIVKAIDSGGLDIIAGVSFVRFPCNDEAFNELGSYYVNEDQEVQVFIVDNDPLMDHLSQHHNIHYIAVRSSNITGKPEEPYAKGAQAYASEIGAPIIAVRSKAALAAQLEDEQIASSSELVESLRRKRMGSQPILVFKTMAGKAVVELVRAGNTTPETMKRLLRDFLGGSIEFVYHEEKVAAHTRKMFEAPANLMEPQQIKEAILEASLLGGKSS